MVVRGLGFRVGVVLLAAALVAGLVGVRAVAVDPEPEPEPLRYAKISGFEVEAEMYRGSPNVLLGRPKASEQDHSSGLGSFRTVVVVDGFECLLPPLGRKGIGFVPEFSSDGTVIRWKMECVDGVFFVQEVSFVESPRTRRKDAVQTRLRVVNESGESHRVGFFAELDPEMGSERPDQLVLPSGLVREPAVLEGDAVPEYVDVVRALESTGMGLIRRRWCCGMGW